MATIKAIEGRSVHQIQSGQVIVDLTSVVKELVENSLDAGATSIDVRFKAQGLEAIEVQDNGSGISKDDYATLGLKHYTSKLSNYDDLAELNTFGFRGEAISSLCALSDLHVITAQDGEAPKGTKLEFEKSGKLKSAAVAATQKGTLVVVENLFQSLPVRRRELEKNIKREYSKVITILNAYACVSTGVRFSVSQQATKGKKVVVFSTRNNLTTKENVANVYGAKTTMALLTLDLSLEMQPTAPSQVLKDIHNEDSVTARQIRVEGHISKPIHGEGRQTPDRQMFFVNSRPCGLPQVAKAFNEVYKSYNMNQSPFVFANLKMDTNTYDVNVSPDKRVIMLHDQQRLLDTLKEALVNLFEAQDQTIPTQQMQNSKLPSYKPLNVSRNTTYESPDPDSGNTLAAAQKLTHSEPSPADEEQLRPRQAQTQPPDSSATTLPSSIATSDTRPAKLIGGFAGRNAEERQEVTRTVSPSEREGPSRDKQKLARKFERQSATRSASPARSTTNSVNSNASRRDSAASTDGSKSRGVDERRYSGSNASLESVENDRNRSAGLPKVTPIKPHSAAPQTPRNQQGVMTVGPTMSKVASGPSSKRRRLSPFGDDDLAASQSQPSQLTSSLHAFAAPGTQLTNKSTHKDGIASFFSRTQAKSPTPKRESIQDEAPDHSSSAGGEVPEDNVEAQPSDSNSTSPVDATTAAESKHKQEEEARVQRMVEKAEGAAAAAGSSSQKRVPTLKRRPGESIHNVVKFSSTSLESLQHQHHLIPGGSAVSRKADEAANHDSVGSQVSPEERLSLSISKSDFGNMNIIGQFNLGFILAVRPSTAQAGAKTGHNHDELFIIDQHASDEIYNFHRLSATTTLTPQPLVRPHPLTLTAIEEETIIDHNDASLAKNGFNISIDTSGDKPVGERCSLTTLPTSKETVFNVKDLEELLVMLAEAPAPSHVSPPLPDVDTSEHLEGVSSHRTLPLTNTHSIVRPSKVRKMLAMRACRSSIMVGKALTQTGMQRVVRHMGEIERPWNCPHGRPTMRHLSTLDKVGGFDEWGHLWKEDIEPWENEVDGDLAAGVWLPSSSSIEGAREIRDEDSFWRGWVNTQKEARLQQQGVEDEDEGDEEQEEEDEVDM